jgi:hypothetical protein
VKRKFLFYYHKEGIYMRTRKKAPIKSPPKDIELDEEINTDSDDDY